VLLRVGIAEEDVAEQARAEPPVRAYGGHDRVGQEGEIRRSHGAVGQTDAEPVVSDQRVTTCESLAEPPEACALPVELEMAHPPRGSYERWTDAMHLVRDATVAQWEEPDLSRPGHR
jgi:hypothetical protein